MNKAATAALIIADAMEDIFAENIIPTSLTTREKKLLIEFIRKYSTQTKIPQEDLIVDIGVTISILLGEEREAFGAELQRRCGVQI